MIGRPFQRGSSGNPGGRPKAVHSIQELARQHAPEAIKTLADIAKNGTPGARVSAVLGLRPETLHFCLSDRVSEWLSQIVLDKVHWW